MKHNCSGDAKLRYITIKVACVLFCWISSAFAENPVKILIFPLDSPPTAGTLSWLSEGITLSISGQLSASGIKVVTRNERFQLVENLDLPPGAHLSHGSMIRVAQSGKADLIILGGGSSKQFERFAPYLELQAEVVPAQMLNEAGIVGAALVAVTCTTGDAVEDRP